MLIIRGRKVCCYEYHTCTRVLCFFKHRNHLNYKTKNRNTKTKSSVFSFQSSELDVSRWKEGKRRKLKAKVQFIPAANCGRLVQLTCLWSQNDIKKQPWSMKVMRKNVNISVLWGEAFWTIRERKKLLLKSTWTHQQRDMKLYIWHGYKITKHKIKLQSKINSKTG